jgi:hypothetical protein
LKANTTYSGTHPKILLHIFLLASASQYILIALKKKWMIGLMDDWIDGSDFKKTIIH